MTARARRIESSARALVQSRSDSTIALRTAREINDRSPPAFFTLCIGKKLLKESAPLPQLPFRIGLHDLGLIAAMAVVQLALPLYLFAVGARYIPAVQATLINLLDVLFNPFWAWLGVGERPTVDAVIGGSLIVGAVLIAIVYGARVAARAIAGPSAG